MAEITLTLSEQKARQTKLALELAISLLAPASTKNGRLELVEVVEQLKAALPCKHCGRAGQ